MWYKIRILTYIKTILKCSQKLESCNNPPHLDLLVLVGEEHHDGQAGDDDHLQAQEDGPEDPVEGDNAGGGVHARLAAGGAAQALERGGVLVNAVGALEREEIGT